ncbi:MAG: DUF1501 domain-containing protein [Planctomycetes bacterium]|nr:DUF1501 domain-containing protein [Planctomycetota bacterium]
MSSPFYREFSRRDLMKIGLASACGVSYSGWLPRLARAAAEQNKPRACIVLWMSGGPTQTDTFDLKPDHANGGPFKPIETAVSGIKISEHLPGLAEQMKDMAIIRGMKTAEGDHGRGTQLMLTGYRPGNAAVRYPSLGSLVAKEVGIRDNELPNYVSLSSFQFAPNVNGAGFLGPQFAPLVVSGNSDNPQARANLSIDNLKLPLGVDEESMKRRVGVLNFLQRGFTSQTTNESAKAHKANYERAVRMVESQAKHAFRLDEETNELRDKYGRNRFGQGCLLARRLVERGVPFVEVALSRVNNNPVSWDTHSDNFNRVRELSGVLDPAWATLMDDLRDRGLLDSTLIVWMGEFGRTPTINTNGGGGRDHFPAAWSTVLAGGLIKGGQVIGDTGNDGMEVINQPVSTKDLYATICSAMGIDHEGENISTEGRPIRIVDEGGTPIKELVG